MNMFRIATLTLILVFCLAVDLEAQRRGGGGRGGGGYRGGGGGFSGGGGYRGGSSFGGQSSFNRSPSVRERTGACSS